MGALLGQTASGNTAPGYVSSPVLANDEIYATTSQGSVTAFPLGRCGSAPPCAPLWSYTPPGGFTGVPAVANESVYLGGNQLTVINASTGAPEWSGAIASGETIQTAVVDNGFVFVVGNTS